MPLIVAAFYSARCVSFMNFKVALRISELESTTDDLSSLHKITSRNNAFERLDKPYGCTAPLTLHCEAKRIQVLYLGKQMIY